MNALEQFQQRIGATPDGVFGKQTLRMGTEHLGLSPMEGVHFFAQCAHESANFRFFEEQLYYRSVKTILKVFSYDFDENRDGKINPVEEEKAERLSCNPEGLANFVYANQNGNGKEETGDGYLFRGRGAIQLTGRANYLNYAKYEDLSIMDNPDLVATEYAFDSAYFFFKKNNLFELCTDAKKATIKKLTKRINGGYNGLEDRVKKTLTYLTLIQ